MRCVANILGVCRFPKKEKKNNQQERKWYTTELGAERERERESNAEQNWLNRQSLGYMNIYIYRSHRTREEYQAHTIQQKRQMMHAETLQCYTVYPISYIIFGCKNDTNSPFLSLSLLSTGFSS